MPQLHVSCTKELHMDIRVIVPNIGKDLLGQRTMTYKKKHLGEKWDKSKYIVNRVFNSSLFIPSKYIPSCFQTASQMKLSLWWVVILSTLRV
jgi:hypothetical protein